MRWIVLLFLPAVLLLVAACDDQSEGTPAEDPAQDSETGASYSEDDTEYKLASIDAGEPLSVDDPSIGVYARLLDELGAKCEDERSESGDRAVVATRLLADEGISVTILDALRGINGSIPEDSPMLSCDEIAAAWVTLMKNQ